MSILGIGALALVAIISAIIATFFGVAGGSILFLSLSLLLSPKEAIPIHGVVQLFNNGVRSWLFRGYINWRIVGYFSLLSMPGAILGGMVYQFFSDSFMEIMVGMGILLANLKPNFKLEKIKPPMLTVVGFLISFLSMVVGVTGPVLTSFLLAMKLTKEDLIATKSMCQVATQLSKTIVFLNLITLDWTRYGTVLVIIMGASFLGIYLTKYLFVAISDAKHTQWIRWLLNSIALMMIVKAIFSLS